MTEVATFRSDGVYSDGRHPDEVRYTRDAAEDVQRRDFTINGLLLDPLRGGGALDKFFADPKSLRSAVIDHVGGLADLDAGLIRAIGRPEKRFEEDQLRLLRAVRFAARFGFEIEPVTLAAIRKLAGRIHAVSRERIREELTKMLTEGRARRAFELLDETDLLVQVLPEVSRMKGVAQPPQFHPEGDVWIHTLMLLEQLEPGCALTLAWGALLHDVGKPPTFRVAPDRIRFDGHVEVGVAIGAEICRRFRFSNDEIHQILALIENHMRFADAPRMKDSTLKRFFRLDDFPEHLALHRMDCLAAHRNLEIWNFVRERYETLPAEEVSPNAPAHRARTDCRWLHAGPGLQGDIARDRRSATGRHDRYAGRCDGSDPREIRSGWRRLADAVKGAGPASVGEEAQGDVPEPCDLIHHSLFVLLVFGSLE